MDHRAFCSIWRDREGTALIETAIILPVLFVLVFGVFEFSWLIFQQHLISTGIEDAARYIARSATPNDPTISRDARYLATTGAIDGNVLRVRGWKAGDVDISYNFIANPLGNDGLSNFRGGAVIESVTASNRSDDFNGHTSPAPTAGDPTHRAADCQTAQLSSACASLRDSWQRARTFAIIGYVGAGVFAGASAALFLLAHRQDTPVASAAGARLACAPALPSAGVTCRLAF